MNATATTDAYRRHALREPAKAAKTLARITETLAKGTLDEARLIAAAEGIRAGLAAAVCCQLCGRRLETDESKARRVGPECWSKRAA